MNIMVPSYLVCIIIQISRLLLLHTSNVYCGGQTSDHVIHMRRPELSSCATVRDKKKEQQSLSKAHYFYFKINIISKSTTAFVLTRI